MRLLKADTPEYVNWLQAGIRSGLEQSAHGTAARVRISAECSKQRRTGTTSSLSHVWKTWREVIAWRRGLGRGSGSRDCPSFYEAHWIDSGNRWEWGMAQEIQKPQTGTLATVKRLYAEAKVTAVAQLLYLMGQQYNLEITPELTALWQESLSALTPNQVRDGFMAYLKSESAHFKPAPGDIIANAGDGKDRPRKIKNPDCPDCRGTGYRMIQVDSITHPGKKANRVTDCFCVRVEYDGKTYTTADRQLPAAPDIPAGEVLARLAKEIPAARGLRKSWPPVAAPKSEAELQELKRQAEQVAGKFKA